MTNQEWADKTAQEIAELLEVDGITLAAGGLVVNPTGMKTLADALLRALYAAPRNMEEEITTDIPCLEEIE